MFFSILITGCWRRPPQGTLFRELSPERTGVAFQNTLTETPEFNGVNYLYFYDGGGVAVGDINNDGLPDIYFTANQRSNRLYLNQGDFRFKDITEMAGVGGGTEGWTTGVAMADVNGDGYLDIYVCRVNYLNKHGANRLFINNGDLTFTEQAAQYGVDHRGLSRQAAFFDYDLDGDLDMYLLNHSVHAKGTYGDTSLRRIRDPEAGDKLYRNDGGRFTDVSAAAGILGSPIGYGLGVAVGDINQDGYPDIYVSNDFHENDYLYYNNGNGTFTEGLEQSVGHCSSASMGNDMADMNNDGLLDIMTLDMLPANETIRKSSVSADPLDVYNVKRRFGYYHQYRRNMFQLNRGPASDRIPGEQQYYELFSEIGQLAGIHATDWSWAPLCADLDNDRRKDLFISNGIYRRPNDLDYLENISRNEVQQSLGGRIEPTKLHRIVGKMPSVPARNYAFQSNGDLTFTNKAQEWGLGKPGFSNGAAYADFDNDGALDLVVNNVNRVAAIYKNILYENPGDSVSGNHYLTIRLAGKSPNTFGIGAKVLLYHDGKIFYQEHYLTRGFQSSVDPMLHFGLGGIQVLDSLKIIWPGGHVQALKEVQTDQILTLRQSDADKIIRLQQPALTSGMFQDVTDQLDLPYRHRENTFVGFHREPFLPHLLSTEGPALAVGDANGDGLEDFFVGGAKHQSGQLFIQKKSGGFASTNDSALAQDSGSEDVDAAFFDADGDGALDLYVVSGGNEYFGEAEPLRDRLYLNDGSGRLVRRPDRLPDLYANGACVKPADIDGDGDLDLFVGSRSVPKEYGVSPQSYLLINDGTGYFTDETRQRAPELSRIGMVTDAVWTDVNNDDLPDLVVVGEWMPVTLLLNRGGHFRDGTREYGLQDTRGWWNTVVAGDVTGDGAIDLVSGNLGWNSILKTSPEAPVRLYLNDFDEDGTLDPILTYAYDGQQYPLVARDLLIFHLPALREKYPTYADYAGQSISDIFPRKQLQNATVKQVTSFTTTLFRKEKDGTFRQVPLPMEAQFAPVHAILITDTNGDGLQDLLLAGNFYGVPPDQGRYDASVGSLLMGKGNGAFQPIEPRESRFIVKGQARHLAKLQLGNGQKALLVARNNEVLQVFRLQP